MASQTQVQKSWLPVFLLLLLALLIVIFALPSLNTNTNTATETASQGQCLPGEQGFDERQEAYTLAQSIETYRSAHPYRGNYGLASYTICYKDGSQQRFPSPPARGYGKISNDNHSEQGLYKWLGIQMEQLTIDRSMVTAIYVVIFSQVVVCDLCREDMISWQRNLRQTAKTNNLYLSIWDIAYGKWIVPSLHPMGSGTPVIPDDLEKVKITFSP